MVGLLIQTLPTKLIRACGSVIPLRIDTCPSKMQQQISKLTQVMLKHKVSQEVEAYKFLHMMAEVRWLLRPRTSRRRWQKPSIRAKEGKLLKSGWGISRPYSWGFPSWYQHRPHESYSQVHSFVFLSWFDLVSLSDSTFDGNNATKGNSWKSQKEAKKAHFHACTQETYST